MDFTAALEKLLGSYVAAVAIILFGIGLLIWKLASGMKGMQNEVDKIKNLPCDNHAVRLDKLSVIETKIDNFPCRAHSEKIDRHHDQLAVTNELLKSLEGKMDMLVKLMPQTTMARRDPLLSDDVPSLSQKNSPKALNDNGRIVAEKFECDAFLEANSAWLLEEVAKFTPKTALDVEMYSLAALKIASSDDRFNDLKNKIYNSPAIPLSVNGETKLVEIGLEDVLFVISLPLRDMYLNIHREILPE